MYTVPSYVTYRTEEDAIYITSELYRNTVRLTDHGLQKEFINLTKKAKTGSVTSIRW